MPQNSRKEKSTPDGVSVPVLGFARFDLPGKQNKWDSIYTAEWAAQDKDPTSGARLLSGVLAWFKAKEAADGLKASLEIS